MKVNKIHILVAESALPKDLTIPTIHKSTNTVLQVKYYYRIQMLRVQSTTIKNRAYH